MKYYFDGKLIRTSKTHSYRFALLNGDKVITCSAEKERCVAELNRHIRNCEDSIETAAGAIKSLNSGKKGYWWKEGRSNGFTSFNSTHSVEKFERRIKMAEEDIKYIKENYRVVELECEE